MMKTIIVRTSTDQLTPKNSQTDAQPLPPSQETDIKYYLPNNIQYFREPNLGLDTFWFKDTLVLSGIDIVQNSFEGIIEYYYDQQITLKLNISEDILYGCEVLKARNQTNVQKNKRPPQDFSIKSFERGLWMEPLAKIHDNWLDFFENKDMSSTKTISGNSPAIGTPKRKGFILDNPNTHNYLHRS
jgi:hypothetical protein